LNIVACLVITKFLLAAWALLSAAEWLANLSLFRVNGLLSWDVLRLRPRLVRSTGMQRVLYSNISLVMVICGRAIAAVALMTTSARWWDFPCSSFLLISCFYVSRRTIFGSDGSDQMGMVIAAGVVVMSAGIVLKDSDLAFCGVFAIAGQAALAYVVAGTAKLVSPVWREGRALSRVMKTQTFGHPLAARIAENRPALCRSLCRTIIVTEMLFPLVFLLPRSIAIACLACFAIFHFCNAYFMGLNAFVWSFLATYPSVILMNSMIRGWLGWA
jgi:hypothetical protein